MSTHEAAFYVQIEPEFTRSGNLWALHAIRMTQRKPNAQLGGTVLVKLSVRVPDAAFMPLQPEVVVVVPETLTRAEPLVVEARDANEGGTDA